MDIVSLLPSFGGLIWTIAAFVIALSIIVAIHEYGHYIVGRWSGIHADVFSVGFGPILWSRHDRHGTRWQIAALPFGGFVKFAGDANAASAKDEAAMDEAAADPAALRRTMHGAPLWARAATVSAGPVFNFVLSIIIFACVAFLSGQPKDPLTVGELANLPSETRELRSGDVILAVNGVDLPPSADPRYSEFLDNLPAQPTLTYTVQRGGSVMDVQDAPYLPPIVAGVTPQSAAIAAGLEVGDVITAIDGTPISAFSELKTAVEGSDGATLALTVWRNGEDFSLELTPKRQDEPQEGGGFVTNWRIGVAAGLSFEPAQQSVGVGEALVSGTTRIGDIITGSVSGLWHMIVGNIGTCNLSGPVGIAQVSGQMASQGLLPFLNFIAVLSTAVGFLNLFPVPALDGGHLVFYAYEAVTGRSLPDRVLQVLMMVGLGMVLTLMVFALWNDVVCP